MNNDDFRAMLASLPKSREAPMTKPKKGKPIGKPNFHRKKKDEGEKTEIDKIYDESQQKLQEIMKQYRDRASERRKVDDNKEMDEAAVRLMIHGIMPTDSNNRRRDLTVEQSKLLGGDLEHTHMVRGLDYTLLEKMKTTAVSSDEEEEKEEDISASHIPPEKVSKNPMVRRMLRIQFHTVIPKRNEHFAPGRMAYICDFENESDVPSTLIRSLDLTPKESPQVKNDKLILEHLTNILPYLRDKKRKKKKKHENEQSGSTADDGTKIFEDAGEYDTRVKPLQIDKSKKDEGRNDKERKSYFDDKRDRDRRDKDDRRDRNHDRRDDRRERDHDRRDRDDRRERDHDRRDRDDDRRERDHDRRDRDGNRRERDNDKRERRDHHDSHKRDRSPERRERSPETSRSRDKQVSALSEAIANESRKRALSPSSASKSNVTTKKKMIQDEAYGEYYTEDMDFVETIASDDDDDEALAMAKARMHQELGTDGKSDKNQRKKFDKKKGNISKADVARKLDNELKKMDEIWSQKKSKSEH
ncbi:hypothetical protein FO519_003733 [Halicephalobus sp. NKZ332]|nr:hypothetical protein FO519_003733 [Halicephalobus sp. NKZ332]